MATQIFAANASGNPRWDLVYATIQVDSSAFATTPRRIKNPSSGAISNVSVPAYLASPVSVGVVAGTPGATPAFPALPADTTGQYNFPLAFVRVPNGFGSTTTVLPQDIRACTGLAGANAICEFTEPSSGLRSVPANGNNDANNSGAAGANAFNVAGSQLYAAGTAGQRPAAFLPPDMVGGFSAFFLIDTVSTNPSHVNSGIVDTGHDWRNRIFRCDIQASAALGLCTGVAANTVCIPMPSELSAPNIRQLANSIALDGQLVASKSTVFYSDHTLLTNLSAGAVVGLYVDPATGYLLWFQNGTAPSCMFAIWIDATAKLANR
jgi:hypothetical protein